MVLVLLKAIITEKLLRPFFTPTVAVLRAADLELMMTTRDLPMDKSVQERRRAMAAMRMGKARSKFHVSEKEKERRRGDAKSGSRNGNENAKDSASSARGNAKRGSWRGSVSSTFRQEGFHHLLGVEATTCSTLSRTILALSAPHSTCLRFQTSVAKS